MGMNWTGRTEGVSITSKKLFNFVLIPSKCQSSGGETENPTAYDWNFIYLLKISINRMNDKKKNDECGK